MLTAGVVFAVANLAPLSVSTATAGHSAGSGYSSYGQRVQFRPMSQRSRHMRTPRWRPNTYTTRRATRSLDRLGSPLISAAKARDPVIRVHAATPSRTGRAGVRAGSSGGHFRPNRRRVMSGTGVAVSGSDSALQAQFRPAPTRRKPTYEQLVAAESRALASYPRYLAGYPVSPQGRYAPYWPGR